MIVFESITCSYCWENIDIALDASVPAQEYVEDCSVCCRPLVIRYCAADGAVVSLDVTPELQ